MDNNIERKETTQKYTREQMREKITTEEKKRESQERNVKNL